MSRVQKKTGKTPAGTKVKEVQRRADDDDDNDDNIITNDSGDESKEDDDSEESAEVATSSVKTSNNARQSSKAKSSSSSSSSTSSVGGRAGLSSSQRVVSELKSLYSDSIKKIEAEYFFEKFNRPPILDSELNSKPTVLFIGQYSVGKTTFITKLLGRNEEIGYGASICEISPHPTTDKFIAIVHGEKEEILLGNTATSVGDLPFQGLSEFGSTFLNKFTTSVVNEPILKEINLIDTPGVLSGERQNSRGYDFSKVTQWFANRCDLIFLMFDPSKLDINDELKVVIESLQPYENKVRCILNKADSCRSTEELIRVYGALLWSMARIFKGAEVTKVFVGSFHNKPLVHKDNEDLFVKDKEILDDQLRKLPEECSLKKVNEMIKRVRLLIVHICILSHLKSKMPVFLKDGARKKLIDNLDEIFKEVMAEKFDGKSGDFPSVVDYRRYLTHIDFSAFPDPSLASSKIENLQRILNEDFKKILEPISSSIGSSNLNSAGGSEESGSDLNVNMVNYNKDSKKKGGSLSIPFAILLVIIIAAVAYFHMSGGKFSELPFLTSKPGSNTTSSSEL